MNRHFFIVLLLLRCLPVMASSMQLAPCELSTARGLAITSAECGWLTVAENPASPDARRIDLRVAVLRARSNNPQPDPLFFFAGGPGQSALESFPAIASALALVRRERDIILIDQRGSGASNPLRCPLPEDLSKLLRTPSAAEIEQDTSDCLRQLDADTRYYTTTQAAADIDAVRQALGYQRINLFGISYGTRLAQVYLRHYPGPVRTVALDGVVPMELILGSEHAPRLEQTLLDVFARCAQEASCNRAFPGVSQHFEALKQKVRAQPTEIEVTLPLSGRTISLQFNEQILAASLRMLAYAPTGQAVLPLLVYEAATENQYQRLTAMALMIVENLSEAIYRGLEVSIICAEDAPFFPETPLHPDTLLGDGMIEIGRQQCQLWPHTSVGAAFHEPVKSEVPVLLLSGEFDPVTPPAYAEEALQYYPNGRHLVGPGQGHGISSRGCAPQLLAEFISAGSAADIDAGCLEELGTTAFFINLLGGEP